MRAIVVALFVALVAPSAQAYMTSCGTTLANGEELMFDLPSFGDQMITLNVGKPHAFRATSVDVKKVKVSGGLFEKEIALKDGARFELRFTKSLTDIRDFRLTADLPEVQLEVIGIPIDCVSYY